MMTIRPGDFWVADIPFTVEGGPLLTSAVRLVASDEQRRSPSEGRQRTTDNVDRGPDLSYNICGDGADSG
jgi:hypothetical protein